MGYFPKGTAGDMYEAEYCDNCDRRLAYFFTFAPRYPTKPPAISSRCSGEQKAKADIKMMIMVSLSMSCRMTS